MFIQSRTTGYGSATCINLIRLVKVCNDMLTQPKYLRHYS